MTRCRICGNESHCGVPLKREERDWGTYTVSDVEICKNCRCELCSDTKESWPGPGVQEGEWSEQIVLMKNVQILYVIVTHVCVQSKTLVLVA